MRRLTQEGTAEPVSRDQILRLERGQGNIRIPSVQLTTSGIGNINRLIHTLAICVTMHAYILLLLPIEMDTLWASGDPYTNTVRFTLAELPLKEFDSEMQIDSRIF